MENNAGLTQIRDMRAGTDSVLAPRVVAARLNE